jgi:hypothetical protein
MKSVARKLGVRYAALRAYLEPRLIEADRTRLKAAERARKRASSPLPWPPLEELEAIYHAHGAQRIADALGADQSSVTRRIQRQRARRGLPTPRLQSVRSSTD